MQITPIDDSNDLYRIVDIFPPTTVEKVLSTDWLGQPWITQEGQESWPRRRVNTATLDWISEFEQHLATAWIKIAQAVGRELEPYQGTAWWLDEPGFTCGIHTDGEMPGAVQLTWIGALPTLGTCFYHHKDPNTLRYQVPMQANSGYVMINSPNQHGYRHLQWHGMLNPVPENTFRLTSYSWLTEKL